MQSGIRKRAAWAVSRVLFGLVMAGLFVGGLCLGGSDGEWFPWINLVGVAMLAAFAVIANIFDADTMFDGRASARPRGGSNGP